MKSGFAAAIVKRALGLLGAGLLLAGPAFPETRSAISSVSVRVQRHAGVVLPAAAAAQTLEVTRPDSAPIAASGNAPSRMIVTSERVAESLAGRRVRGADRIAVTVFEP